MQRFEGLMLHVPQDQVSALREPIVWARLSVVERGPNLSGGLQAFSSSSVQVATDRRLFGADGNSPIEEPSAAPEQGTTT
jgi:hypothetical protein